MQNRNPRVPTIPYQQFLYTGRMQGTLRGVPVGEGVCHAEGIRTLVAGYPWGALGRQGGSRMSLYQKLVFLVPRALGLAPGRWVLNPHAPPHSVQLAPVQCARPRQSHPRTLMRVAETRHYSRGVFLAAWTVPWLLIGTRIAPCADWSGQCVPCVSVPGVHTLSGSYHVAPVSRCL